MEEKKQYSQELSKAYHQRKVWDCGSTLYDSFELNSLKRQLDSAIASRTLSMPHIPDRRFEVVPPPPPPPIPAKKSSKISRSLNRLVKSIFSKTNKLDRLLKDRNYVVYDKSGSLDTIPEEDAFSLEMYPSSVRKTASHRFKAARVIGISCS